ncbi:10168_t:CDS:2, partial [Racocetra persica]
GFLPWFLTPVLPRDHSALHSNSYDSWPFIDTGQIELSVFSHLCVVAKFWYRFIIALYVLCIRGFVFKTAAACLSNGILSDAIAA